MNGILVVNKESNMTSRDVVNRINSLLHIRKAGHAGTLDPIARGVLIICIGKYTKLVDLMTNDKKEYIATIKLGLMTDTHDITGNIMRKEEVKKYTREEILKVLHSFLGKSMQVVPKYSAVHVNGKRLYEYARNDIEVILPKREIFIYDIELINYINDEITFRTVVSKGTYIRSLINDICTKLKTVGTMAALTRTKQGIMDIKDSYTLEDISNNNFKLLEIEDVIKLKVVLIDDTINKQVSNGVKINDNYDGYILYKYNDLNIALYFFENKVGLLKILF